MEPIYIGILPLTTLAFSFIMPLIHYATKGDKRVIQSIALIGSLIAFTISIEIVLEAYSVNEVLTYRFGGWPPPIGITYMLDRVNSLLVLVTTGLMLLITIYNYRYLEHYNGLGWFYTLYFGLETGLLGIFLTGDVFNLFVMIEVSSVSSYSLVMFYRDRGDSITAGLKYAFIGSLGTTMYFLALGIIYATFGTVNLFDLTTKVHGGSYWVTGQAYGDIVLGSALALVLASWTFMIKAGVFPNHFWLPDAHPAAPSPISAVLSGLVVNAGAYAMFRYMYIIYGGTLSTELSEIVSVISLVFLITGSASAIIGSLLMHVQRDIKRIIAYSTIMHLGYLFMALGTRDKLGLEAFTLHMINHSIAKASLFLVAGIYIHCIGSRLLDKLSGIGSLMPLTTFALAVSAFNLAGVPPLPIFYSKLLLFNALFSIHPVYGLVIVATSALALLAYIKLLYVTLLGGRVVKEIRREPISMLSIVLVLTIIMIAMGLATQYILDKYITPAVEQAFNVGNYMITP